MSEEAQLWVRHRREDSKESLDALCEYYLPLLEIVARAAAKHIRFKQEQEDLLTPAYFGLRTAIKNFDAATGVPFRHYAKNRIFGAILDDLRAQDTASRLVRSFQTKANRAVRTLSQELLREPDDREIADYLGMDFAEYLTKRAWWYRSTQFMSTGLVMEMENGANVVWDAPGDFGFDTTQQMIDAEAFERCLKVLNKQQAAIFRLRFLSDMNMAAIGKLLGLSESRVCQLVNRLLPVVWEQYRKRFAA